VASDEQPRAFATLHDWEPLGRHATWLELFFDIVVVAAIANLALLLHDDYSLAGSLAAFGLFVPIWWVWISFSYFADLFDTGAAASRCAQLVAMFGTIVLAIVLGDGVADDGHVFALTCSALFVLLAVMYAVAGRNVPAAAELCRWYVAGSLFGAVGWLLSAAIEPPGRYVLWAVALVGNAAISGPIAYARMRQAPSQVSHMDERFGLFSIVVLGETVLAVVRGLGTTEWALSATVTAVAGFVIAACIWWVYFSAFDDEVINRAIGGGRSSQVRSFFYGYGHLPAYTAVIGIGVGVHVAIEHAADDHFTPSLLGWSIVALVTSFMLIGYGSDRLHKSGVITVKIAVAAVSLAACTSGLPTPVAVSVTASAWLGLVLYEQLVFLPALARLGDNARIEHG
jgi:low temperature requirement protein LtrA